ncbi:MAG: DUF374 domain-containing protein [Puniceicoccales bacterium]|nr:DUF374 domain-containing protein [Puniceicoccales bacterium]
MQQDGPAIDARAPHSPEDGRPAPERQVNRAPWWLWCVLFPMALFVRLWLATLRIQAEPAQLALWDSQAGRGRLFLFWHNRLVLSPALKRRFVPGQVVNGLISASRDGAWLTVFFELLGIRVIRGSSSWRGPAALLEIKRRLALGEDAGITPDGPRGPCYAWKGGGVRLALRTGHPLFLVGLRFHCARRLASWDGLYIPVPFSRVELRLDYLAEDDPLRMTLSEEDLSENLRRRLEALTDDSGMAWTPRVRRGSRPDSVSGTK